MSFSIHSVMPFTVGMFFCVVGLYVFLKRRGAAENRAYALWCYTTVHWQLIWAVMYSVHDPLLADWLIRFGYSGIIFIPITFYDFIITFLKQSSRFWRIKIAYLLGFVFLIAVWSGHSFVRGAYDYFWGYYPRVGWMHLAYLMLLACLVWDGLSLLIHEATSSKGVGARKTQVRYVAMACGIYVLAAIDFLANYGIKIYPIGVLFTLVSLGLVTYAIAKHQLLEVPIVVRKTLLYSFITAVLASLYGGVITALARFLENQSMAPGVFPMEVFHWVGHNLKVAFASSCVSTAALSMGLGLFVWFKGARHPLHRLWMFFCIAVSFWSLGIGMMVYSETFTQAYFWQTWVLYSGSIMIPVLFLHFVMLISEIRSPHILKSGYFMAAILLAINMSGHLATVKVHPPFNFYTDAFKAYNLFTVYFFSMVCFAHFLLLKKMYLAESRLKNQIKYIFVGTAIGFCGGATTFFPIFNISVFPYGIYAVPFYIVTASYAIFRHQLMDIDVVIRKTLLYSLVSAALAAVYVGTITLLAYMLGGSRGSTSAFSSALAAIFITLLFNPVRLRVQRLVDRYFPREAVDQVVLREITGAFVHEIKMPLSNIILPAELTFMDMEDLEEGRKSAKELIPKIKRRMKYIMNQSMLAGRRVEAVGEITGQQNAVRDPVDLNDIIERSLKQTEKIMRRTKTDVHVEIPADLPPVLGDPGQLEIVFVNLLKNAAEAMANLSPERVRKIIVRAQLENARVSVRISDTGSGIKDGEKEKIFLAHYTTKGPHGAGMGLFLCKQIVEAHKGTINVLNTEQGAGFHITFPQPMTA